MMEPEQKTNVPDMVDDHSSSSPTSNSNSPSDSNFTPLNGYVPPTPITKKVIHNAQYLGPVHTFKNGILSSL